jgi:eukaryotic-like serine/threonine-protein kinase
MSESTADRNPFERLAEEFAERLRRGEDPAITDYVAQNPEHADEIRELFPEIAAVERCKPARPDLGISSPAVTPARPGGLPEALGDYRILRYLGEGGMGVVYEAVRESLRTNVALKVMHPQFRTRQKYLRRFHTEARSAARLHHTNIVSVFDYGVHDGVCYYAMQYIAGQTLDKVLADVRQLRREEAASLTGDTATLAFNTEERPRPGERGNGRGAGHPVSKGLQQTVTLGLLTGGWSTTPPPDGSLALDRLSRPMASAATGDANPTEDPAARLDLRTVRTVGNENDPAGARAFPAGFKLAPTQALSVAVDEPPPGCKDTPGCEPLEPVGSTSTLTGKIDARYYREVARLGAQVACALAYAHERHILHRDIKPPNLILDAMGNLWITDFGLAKFEDGEDASQSQDLVGTLRYMAPERFRSESNPQCDIYALGATLYEMLTFRPPFEGKDQLDLIRRIEKDAPTPPRQLERGIPHDLETIVLKALAKNPGDRFQSADGMADELRRFVDGRPIRSRSIPAYQRFWRWCKRNPGLAAANISAAVLTTVLAIVSTLAAWTYREQRNEIGHNLTRITASEAGSRRARTEAREELFKALLDRARAGRFSHRMGQRFDSLDALEQASRIGRELNLAPEKFESLRDEAIACLALPDLKAVGRAIAAPPNALTFAFDATLRRYALRFRDGTISVRRVADDQEIAHFQAPADREFWGFGLSPDGRYLATTHSPGEALTVWDVDRKAVAVNEPGPTHGHSARFSPDSRRIVLVNVKSRELLVYDLATGQTSRRWPVPGQTGPLAFRPDGAQIAAIDTETKSPACRILEEKTGRLVQAFPLRVPAEAVAWSPDGTMLATAGGHPDSKIDLWDAVTGVRRATLEGHDNGGLRTSFHPAGTLLASNGWESRLRLWDPIQGRPLFSLSGGSLIEFSRDGRIVHQIAGQLTTYQAEPALEYRTLAHAAREPMDYCLPSIRHDGRILAVGSDRGAVLWDLALGTELAFLPIGSAGGVMFEPSGDLITCGDIGVQRWPVHLDRDRGEFRIGPPQRLPLPVTDGGFDQDRSGRLVAVAAHRYAYVATAERTIRVGPLDDCRGVSVSPDGQWLATINHLHAGAQIWRISNLTKVAELPTGVRFSPDGKWLVARWFVGDARPLRVWEVGTWREETRSSEAGENGWFSPDGRIVVVVDPSRIIRLVELATGRTLARLESPDLPGVYSLAFSRDGSRLVFTTKDRPTPCVHVWDLRAIRKHLFRLGLDWDAPAYSEDDPADPKAPPLPALQVDYGPLAEHLQHFNEHDEVLVERYTARLQSDPNDADAYHHRAHALASRRRFPEAIADLDQAIRLRPKDAHLRDVRGRIHASLKQYEPAIADLEAALAMKSDQPQLQQNLAQLCNNRAWELANGPAPRHDLKRALTLAQRAVELVPDEGTFLNTMGVVLFRTGRYAEAIATLERSLAAGRGRSDAFDLFFLAMARCSLGQMAQARADFDRALRWQRDGPSSRQPGSSSELAAFQAEADAALAGPGVDLPDDVFATPR